MNDPRHSQTGTPGNNSILGQTLKGGLTGLPGPMPTKTGGPPQGGSSPPPKQPGPFSKGMAPTTAKPTSPPQTDEVDPDVMVTLREVEQLLAAQAADFDRKIGEAQATMERKFAAQLEELKRQFGSFAKAEDIERAEGRLDVKIAEANRVAATQQMPQPTPANETEAEKRLRIAGNLAGVLNDKPASQVVLKALWPLLEPLLKQLVTGEIQDHLANPKLGSKLVLNALRGEGSREDLKLTLKSLLIEAIRQEAQEAATQKMASEARKASTTVVPPPQFDDRRTDEERIRVLEAMVKELMEDNLRMALEFNDPTIIKRHLDKVNAKLAGIEKVREGLIETITQTEAALNEVLKGEVKSTVMDDVPYQMSKLPPDMPEEDKSAKFIELTGSHQMRLEVFKGTKVEAERDLREARANLENYDEQEGRNALLALKDKLEAALPKHKVPTNGQNGHATHEEAAASGTN